MNLLSVLSKLDKNDVINIRCWLGMLDWKRKKTGPHDYYHRYKVPADVAFLNKDELREGAEEWARAFELPRGLTQFPNATRETARKIFGEDS